MAGKFIISTTKSGEFTFNLKAGNGEIILAASEGYSTLSACEEGVASVKENALAPIEDQTRNERADHPKYEIYLDGEGQFRFNLKNSNGEVIGKSEGYKAKASARKGIASIGRNAPDAPVVVVEAN